MRARSIRRISILFFAVLLFSGLLLLPPAQEAPAQEGKALLDVYLASPDSFVPGTEAALRVLVKESRSFLDSAPVEGAGVTLRLHPEEGNAITLFTGATDRDGLAQLRFRVPELPDGSYKMTLHATAETGEQTLEHKVTLSREAKILLVCDKPLYQPGQVLHLRSLALQAFNLQPLAGQDLTFEIEDSKGNKVFKHSGVTDEFGVAHVDFQLADEVNVGAYTVRALMEKTESEKTVTVKKYVLPRFKLAITADKTFYLPQETIKGEIQVDYMFGKPVAGGEVTIKAATFDVEFKPFEEIITQTDEQGHASFELTLPDYFVGQPLEQGNALVKLEVSVKDQADHTQKAARTYPVSAQPLQLGIIAESGKLIPDVENRLFVVAAYPDRSPARAQVTVTVNTPKEGDRRTFELSTNESGIGSFELTPTSELFQQGAWVEVPAAFGRGGPWGPQWTQESVLSVSIEARDENGQTATLTHQVKADFAGDAILMRTDKAIYQAGETLRIDLLAPFKSGTVYLDVLKAGQVILTAMAELSEGRGAYELPLTPDLFGSLEIHAYKLLDSGSYARDTKLLYVNPPDDLTITVQPDKETYLPGENAVIDFVVTDEAGQAIRAALGVIIVDESVYALQDLQPGLEKVYFTLEKELQTPKFQLEFAPVSIPQLVTMQELEARRQQAAQVLLAAAEPAANFRWVSNPAAKRTREFAASLQAFYWALNYYVHYSNEPFATYDKDKDEWSWRADLIKRLLHHGNLQEAHLRDPWKGRLTMDDLATLEQRFRVETWVEARNANIKNQVFGYLQSYVVEHAALRYDAEQGRYEFIPGLVEKIRQKWSLDETLFLDVKGDPYTFERLAEEEEAFSPENLARLIDALRKQRIFQALQQRAMDGKAREMVGWDDVNSRWVYRSGVLVDLAKSRAIPNACLLNANGQSFNLTALREEWKGFAPENVMSMAFFPNIQQVFWALFNWCAKRNQEDLLDQETNSWTLPENVLSRLGRTEGLDRKYLFDPWGQALRLERRAEAVQNGYYYTHQLRFHALVSAGPDGEFGTADDLSSDAIYTNLTDYCWPSDLVWYRGARGAGFGGEFMDGAVMLEEGLAPRGGIARNELRARQKAGAPHAMPPPAPDEAPSTAEASGAASSPARPKIRVREYFPETLLWNPAVITDQNGRARIELKMADTITTWRLTASASSPSGALGSTTHPILVFQDFFVDIDFPVALTQNDEVSVPIAVYNYLKEPQKLDLVVELDENDPWFDLLDEAQKSLSLDAGEVNVVYFRVKARKLGYHKLTVNAYGTKMSDAVRKGVEVVPDGQRQEQVLNGRLQEHHSFELTIPQQAIEDASKITVKLYPGVFSQLMDGLGGMLRLPGG